MLGKILAVCILKYFLNDEKWDLIRTDLVRQYDTNDLCQFLFYFFYFYLFFFSFLTKCIAI